MSPAPEAATRLSDRERLAWLRLIRTENVGPATFHELLRRFGTAAAALDALPDLSKRGGRARLCLYPEADARREIEALARMGGRFIAFGEPGYPPHLSHIDGAPPLIAVIGADQALASPAALAIVGARNASLGGQKIAAELAQRLGAAGFVVVSGLARGIDAAAHRAAVTTGTVAVLAGGVDVVYPTENLPLLEAVLAAGGAAVSEMPMGWQPRARDFPRRNRLISGLSLGVVLVEAARASGSLHTARFALEQNREVFVVPGSPLDPRSEGGNRLIRQGATLVGDADDVLESLGGRRSVPAPILGHSHESAGPDATVTLGEADRDRILAAIGAAPVEIDDLIRHLALPAHAVHVVLLELELAGRVERHAGHSVSLISGSSHLI